jgi:hypothetical protein
MRRLIVGGVLVALVVAPASSASGGCGAERGAVHAAFATLQTDSNAAAVVHHQIGSLDRRIANAERLVWHWRAAIGENDRQQGKARWWLAHHCKGHGAHAAQYLCLNRQHAIELLQRRQDSQRQHIFDLEALEDDLSGQEAALSASFADLAAQVDADRQALVDAKSALAACEAG